MAQLCVTDETKDELAQKKKELADARGVDVLQVSYTDVLLWLCESQPKSKGERLRLVFDKLRQELTLNAGPVNDDKLLKEFHDQIILILCCPCNDKEKMVAYTEDLKEVIHRIALKYPFKTKSMARKSTDDAQQRTDVD